MQRAYVLLCILRRSPASCFRGSGITSLGFLVSAFGLEFRVQGFRFRVSGLGNKGSQGMGPTILNPKPKTLIPNP